jgi:hypothetical protein
VCVLVIVACGYVYGATFAGPIDHRGDLLQDWVSGRNHLAGLPLYASLPRSVRLHTGEAYRGLPVNAHPPAAVLVFLPWARLDYAAAYRTWVIFSLALVGLVAWGVARELGFPSWWLLPLCAFLLVSRPLEEELVQGQFNALLLALMTGAWMLVRRKRSFGSGLLVGLAAAIKLFPGFLALYFVGRRSWRGLLGVALGLAFANAAALAVFGSEPFETYLRQVVPASALYHESWHNASLYGLWHKLFDPQRFTLPLHRLPEVARIGSLLSSAAVAVVVVVGVGRARGEGMLDRGFALTALGMLLASPLLWEHYLLLALLPLMLLWSQTAPGDPARWVIGGMAALLMLLRQAWVWSLAEGLMGEPLQAGEQRLARPVYTLTILAYPAYTLLALFLLTWLRGPTSAGAARRPAQ